MSAKRARQLADGAEPNVPANGDKPTVIALREIAEGFITKDILDEKETETQMDLAEFAATEETITAE